MVRLVRNVTQGVLPATMLMNGQELLVVPNMEAQIHALDVLGDFSWM